MLKILGNMKTYWKAVAIVLVILLVQAVCDLALPNYTSDLIDVGIQNSGIEYSTPKEISAKSYTMVSLFMTDEEVSLWNSSYEKQDDGIYYLKDTSAENMKTTDAVFTTPIAISYMVMQSNSTPLTQSGMDLSALPQAQLDAIKTQIAAVRTDLEERISTMGDSMIHSSAVAFTKAEYSTLGLDVNAMQTSYLWKTGSKMLAMALVVAACAVAVGFLASRVGAGIGRDLREKVFQKVVSFSSQDMNQFSTASLITRTTNDIQQVQMVSTILIRMIFYSPILAIGAIIMVMRTGAGMGWIIFVAVAAILCIVTVLLVVAMPKFKLMQKLVDKVNLISREILTGLTVIRAFGREKEEEKRFDGANKELTATMLFTNRAMTFMMPTMTMIMYGITLLIVWVSAHKIDAGSLEVGAMTAFITYTMMIVMSFLMLTIVSIMLPRAGVAADRIDEVIKSDVHINDPKQPKVIENKKGLVAFHDVAFKYPGAEGNILEHIDFEAAPGKTTAIIGSTGCGKSTLVQLIPRFYDVTEGSITIDGVDIRDLSQHDLRAMIGFVPQKGILFSGTIASNLRYGAPDATDEKMMQAAQIAQATEFIEEKAEKYDSAISQGGDNVSGGQKQRLSIARAIAKNPEIYIFDDSFSALDYKTDIALRKALSDQVKDRTVMIVAQRISTVLHADQILVLEDGSIAGKGTHKELMETCEVYRQIANSQLSEKELKENVSGKENA